MNSVKKNFIYQASYEILAIILPLITSPYIARVLGAENIGISSYTLTIANYFILFCALGIKNYGNREISIVRNNQEELDKTFSEIFFLHLCLSLVVLFIYLVTCFFAANDIKKYMLIQSIHVLAAVIDISWLFFGLEEFKKTVTRNTLIKIASVVCTFVFVKSKNDLSIYMLIVALGVFFGQAYLWVYIKQYVTFRRVDFKSSIRHLNPLLVLFIPTLAISVYNYMDKIMLGLLSSKIDLGYYENSEKIIFAASAVLYSLGTVMMPRMSNMVAKGETDLEKKYINISTQFIAMFSCALCFGLIGISKVFAPVFWGSDYIACSGLLALLALVLPIKGIANVFRTQYLIPNKRDKEYIISVCTGAFVNLIINFILIPKYQAYGATIGTIAAELSVLIVQYRWCKKDIPVDIYLKSSWVYAIFGIVMGICVFLVGHMGRYNIITLGVQIVTGIIVYGLLCIVYYKRKKPELLNKYLSKLFR